VTTLTEAPALVEAPGAPRSGSLPQARSVLAVTARPGPESADLGGLLCAFRRGGATIGVICLTRGEASPFNATCARLETVRPWELQLAAHVLGCGCCAALGNVLADGRDERPAPAGQKLEPSVLVPGHQRERVATGRGWLSRRSLCCRSQRHRGAGAVSPGYARAGTAPAC
jgi:hypothetical protein